jgi:hypothetical protein
MANQQDFIAADGAQAASPGSIAGPGVPSGAGAAAAGPDSSSQSRPTTGPGSPAVGPIRLADGLGVASAGLGAPMLISPQRFLDAIGIEPGGKADAITIGVGVREVAATGTIMVMRHRRIGAWSRVAGDLMDLTLLGRAYQTRRTEPTRLAAAAAFVTAILAADLYAAIALSRAEGTHIDDGSSSSGAGVQHDTGGSPARVRTAITVLAPADEVRRAFHGFAWSAFDPATVEAAGDLRFVPAPGDRGTEVHLDHDPGVRGGRGGALLAKLSGRSPDQAINDELRRFKSLVETGVEVRSDKTPEGPSAYRQMVQQPAQPVGGEA